MKVLNCAVIGVGYLGRFHAQKYLSLPNVKLVGVCDSNKETCLTVSNELQVPAYLDYKELFGKVDAVSIAATTNMHYAIAKDCLSQGIHVLLEKPITETVKQANELINIAKKNKVKFQIGHLERFNSAHLALNSHLDSPYFIESQRLAPFISRCTDTNVIVDLMIHDIDLIQGIVNSPITHIEAQGAPVLSKLIDIAYVRLTFQNQCIANLTASRVSLSTERVIKILQPNSYIAVDYCNHQLSVFENNNSNSPLASPPYQPSLTKKDALLEEIKAFLLSIETNTSPIVTGEDGRNALSIAERITSLINFNSMIPKIPATPPALTKTILSPAHLNDAKSVLDNPSSLESTLIETHAIA